LFSNISPENLEIVDFVVNKLKKRSFSFLTEEDVAQEAYLIAAKVIKKWDGVRSLEHFLMLAISRRLVSLSRNYFKNASKRCVTDFQEVLVQPTVEYDLITPDLVDYILDNLSISMRSDYQRWANGVSLTATRRVALVNMVKELIDGQD